MGSTPGKVGEQHLISILDAVMLSQVSSVFVTPSCTSWVIIRSAFDILAVAIVGLQSADCGIKFVFLGSIGVQQPEFEISLVLPVLVAPLHSVVVC